jgi:hypothetical protein
MDKTAAMFNLIDQTTVKEYFARQNCCSFQPGVFILSGKTARVLRLLGKSHAVFNLLNKSGRLFILLDKSDAMFY